MNGILYYLTALEQNNNRGWFHANKKQYEQTRWAYLELVQKVIGLLFPFTKFLNKALEFKEYE